MDTNPIHTISINLKKLLAKNHLTSVFIIGIILNVIRFKKLCVIYLTFFVLFIKKS